MTWNYIIIGALVIAAVLAWLRARQLERRRMRRWIKDSRAWWDRQDKSKFRPGQVIYFKHDPNAGWGNDEIEP